MDARDFEVTITPRTATFRVGDRAEFAVRIRNIGQATAYLVASVDGSDAGASPHVSIEIDGPPDGYDPRPRTRCSYMNGVNNEDFIAVPPGEVFDPYVHGYWGAVRARRFRKAGRFSATFRYVTTEPNPADWWQSQEGEPSEPFLRLLARVPRVELAATTSFDVVP